MRLPPRVAITGARMAPRKPPFCIICGFFFNEVFFIDRRLRFCLLWRSAVFCLGDNCTLPHRMFLAHSLANTSASRNSLLQSFAYWLFPCFPTYLFDWVTAKIFSYDYSYWHFNSTSMLAGLCICLHSLSTCSWSNSLGSTIISFLAYCISTCQTDSIWDFLRE